MMEHAMVNDAADRATVAFAETVGTESSASGVLKANGETTEGIVAAVGMLTAWNVVLTLLLLLEFTGVL